VIDIDSIDAIGEQYARPGHDRECLRAMYSQAGMGFNKITQIQVRHLLSIAWRAGANAEAATVWDGVTEDCQDAFAYARAMAKRGYSRDRLVATLTQAYGPKLPWRTRARLARRLIFGRRP
jgi:hypothetical protein